MAFSDEALRAKLATLSETQDSIVSVSQWITFHKRHADRIANLWLTRLRDSPPAKRLNFVYLVNDIVQNARARKRNEFPDAFAPLMPEAIETAYRSSTPEIQTKLRRVLDVWKARATFETAILEAVEGRLDNVDKSKGSSSGKKTLMGKSLFGSSSDKPMPKELESLGPLQIAVTKAKIDARPAVDGAQKEYNALFDPEGALPTPPVYAARLTAVVKQLTQAETALGASVKARTSLIADLEKILEINKTALSKDEDTLSELSSRKTNAEAKKRDVEDAIMRGLSSSEGDAATSDSNAPAGYDRPEVEELTPEPEGLPLDDGGLAGEPTSNPAVAAALSGFGETGHTPGKIRQASNSSLNGPSTKRRKMSHGDDQVVPDLGAMGMDGVGPEVGSTVGSLLDNLDADVDELLQSARQE